MPIKTNKFHCSNKKEKKNSNNNNNTIRGFREVGIVPCEPCELERATSRRKNNHFCRYKFVFLLFLHSDEIRAYYIMPATRYVVYVSLFTIYELNPCIISWPRDTATTRTERDGKYFAR